MKNEIIWGEILQIRFISRGQSALQSIPWTKSLDPDLCLLDLWIGSSTVFFREVAARWRRVCVMSPDAVQSSHFSHTSLKWPLFLFPPAPFGSSQSGDNGVMVCVGKTELCSTARNWFFFRICVCGSKAPSARMGFPPIEGPGPGHRQLRRPGPSSLPVLWEFQSIARKRSLTLSRALGHVLVCTPISRLSLLCKLPLLLLNPLSLWD